MYYSRQQIILEIFESLQENECIYCSTIDIWNEVVRSLIAGNHNYILGAEKRDKTIERWKTAFIESNRRYIYRSSVFVYDPEQSLPNKSIAINGTAEYVKHFKSIVINIEQIFQILDNNRTDRRDLFGTVL